MIPRMTAPSDVLARVALFEGLGPKELDALARTVSERRFHSGQQLTGEGETGAGFFVLAEGEAAVTVDGQERRTLGPGDWFGELALIEGGTRTATVTATTDGLAYGLTSWQFRPLVEAHPALAWPLLQQLARRIRELEQLQRDHV
jgi:CRP-like cAMP-binding protein